MKTIEKIIMFLCINFILFSCNSDDVSSSNSIKEDKIVTEKNLSSRLSDLNVDFEKVRDMFLKIRDIKDLESQKLAFKTLTNDEKAIFWNIRLEYFINENKLDSNQKNVVNKVKEFITPEIFNKNSIQNDAFDAFYMDEILGLCEQTLTPNQFYNMVYQLNSFTPVTIDPTQQKVCVCAVGSKYTCARIKPEGSVSGGNGPVTFTLSASIEFGNCSSTKCVATDGGCGGFWSQDCTGSTCTY